MTIQFDNDQIIGADSTFLITRVEGLGPVRIRTSSFIYSGRSGGKVTKQFNAMREVSIEGLIKSTTCDEHVEDRQALTESLPIDTLIPVHITLFNGQQYLMYAHPQTIEMEYEPGGKRSRYKIELLAGDPLLYDDTSDPNTATVGNAQAGGFVLPVTLPIIFEGGAQPIDVTNFGNEIVYPVITLTHAGSDPVITNETTGESFELDIDMIEGDVIEIDMLNRTVTLNDGNIIGNKVDGSIWWGLQPGVNGILLDTAGASDAMEAEITWRSGYSGV